MVLVGLTSRFGALTVLPVHPRPGLPATRIIIQGRKGSRAPLVILPGMILNEADGHGFRPDVETILRNGVAFELNR